MTKPSDDAREGARVSRSYGSSNVHKRRPGQAAAASGAKLRPSVKESHRAKSQARPQTDPASALEPAALDASPAGAGGEESATAALSAMSVASSGEAAVPARKKPTKRRIAMPQSSRGLKRAGVSGPGSASDQLPGAASPKGASVKEPSAAQQASRETSVGAPARRSRLIGALNGRSSGSAGASESTPPPSAVLTGSPAEGPFDIGAPAADAAAAPAAAGTDAPSAHRARPTARSKARPALLVAGAVALALVIALAGLSWDRWARFDDAADFQGVWYAAGTDTAVSVDAETIKLTADVSYRYVLDPVAKTVSYTFGKNEGEGRYWFAANRTRLVIVDGAGYTAASTLIEDAGRTLDALLAALQGREVPVPEGEGVIVLDRTPAESTGVALSDQNAAGSSTPDSTAPAGATSAGSTAPARSSAAATTSAETASPNASSSIPPSSAG